MRSETATAHLAWNPYTGPGFVAYEVRRTDEGGGATVHEMPGDVSSSRFVDSLREGNTEDSYQVVVRTEWGPHVVVAAGALISKFERSPAITFRRCSKSADHRTRGMK